MIDKERIFMAKLKNKN